MSNIPDNRKLKFINIPGTHDSCAYYVNRLSNSFAKTQFYSVEQQLEIGTRKLDLRVINRNKYKDIDEDLIFCHGICNCYASNNFGDFKKLTYKSVLMDIRNFLEKNPSETVMIGMQLGRGKNTLVLKRAYELLDKLVGDIIMNYDSNLTLGAARGKIINLKNIEETTDEKNPNTKVFKLNPLAKGTGIEEVHSKYRNYKTFKVNGNLKIQEMKDMFELYNMTINEAENKENAFPNLFPVTYSISCTGEKDYCLPCPRDQADIVHPFFQKEGVLKKGYYYGWLNMDFGNIMSNYKLIDTNFY